MPRPIRGLLVVGLAVVATACGGSDQTASPSSTSPSHRSSRPSTTLPRPPSTTTTLASTGTSLHLLRTITGTLSPKSVVASGDGLFFAQNMMYNHTITVYNRSGALVATIPDTVRLSDYGFPYTAPVRGAPVEAAFTRDGGTAYVSNYSMFGPGFGHQGSDTCSPGSGVDRSFVYRIAVFTLRITNVIEVGSVPKYVALTPDGRYLLVSNWCSYDLSIVDTATNKEIARIPIGAYPRGIVVDPSSGTAYVAVMGSTDIAKVRLAPYTGFPVSWIRGVGSGPRHLVMDHSGRYLYATLNGEGRVIKIDLTNDAVVGSASTGSAPRSMAIAADGQSLYVVNYESATIAKVNTADMRVVQTVRANLHPIGITYDPGTGQVWVACYSGSIMVFADS